MMSVVLFVVCSSANAYMLMYRRVDKVENAGESTETIGRLDRMMLAS